MLPVRLPALFHLRAAHRGWLTQRRHSAAAHVPTRAAPQGTTPRFACLHFCLYFTSRLVRHWRASASAADRGRGPGLQMPHAKQRRWAGETRCRRTRCANTLSPPPPANYLRVTVPGCGTKHHLLAATVGRFDAFPVLSTIAGRLNRMAYNASLRNIPPAGWRIQHNCSVTLPAVNRQAVTPPHSLSRAYYPATFAASHVPVC